MDKRATYIDTFPATWDVYINFFIVYSDSFDAKLSTEEHHGVFEVLGDAFSKLCKSWRKDKERPDGITCKYWRIAFLCSKLHKIIGTLRFAFLPPTCICYTMPSRDLCKIHEGMFDKPEGVARGFITHSRVFLHRSLEGMV